VAEKTVSHKIREVATHTVVYGIGSALQTIMGYVLIPLYTKFFTADVYGVFSLITLCGTLGGAFFYLGASSALSRSYYDYPEGPERRAVVSTALYLTICGASAQIVIGLLARNQLSLWLFSTTQYAPHIAITLASSAMTFVAGLFYLVLRFERRSTQVVVLNLCSVVFTIGLISYLLVVRRMGIMAPVLGTAISQALMTLALFYLCRDRVTLGCQRAEFRIQLAYGIPAVFIGLAYYTLDWLDRLVISHYTSLAAVGVYSLGYKLGMVIHTLFIIPFAQIWAPMQMEYRHDRDAAQLFSLMPTYYVLVGLCFAVPISVFSREIVGVLANRDEYLAGFRIVAPVLLAHLAYGSLNVLNNGLLFERKMAPLMLIFWVGVVLNFAMNVLMIPRFGYEAAAFTKLASYVVLAAMAYRASRRWFPQRLEAQRLTKLIVAGVLSIAVGSRLSLHGAPATFLAKSTMCAAFGAFVWAMVLDRPEKRRLRLAASTVLFRTGVGAQSGNLT
jgi:O-antigen/teichoic acid export membrane protein